MKKIAGWLIPFLTFIIPICWDLLKEEKKELTIAQERKINILETFGEGFDIYTNDSLKLNNYILCEYSITNTGNKTIIGFGTNSDILTNDNSLCIAPDSIIVNSYLGEKIANLEDNCISFKQIRPGEKITLICATNKDVDGYALTINDRDVKDTNIRYVTYDDKLTNFEKISMEDKWGQVVGFSINLVLIIVYVAISLLDVFEKRKPLPILLIIIWLICFAYTLSLPIRWLL